MKNSLFITFTWPNSPWVSIDKNYPRSWNDASLKIQRFLFCKIIWTAMFTNCSKKIINFFFFFFFRFLHASILSYILGKTAQGQKKMCISQELVLEKWKFPSTSVFLFSKLKNFPLNDKISQLPGSLVTYFFLPWDSLWNVYWYCNQ